jgi:phosphatidylglycerophosphate synthase
MGIYAIKPRFRMSLRGLERRAIAAGISADQLTTAGTLCAFAAAGGVLLTGWDSLWAAAAASFALLRLACNALDGMVASDTGTARPLGQVYNEFSDRLGDSAIFLAVAVRSQHLLLGATTVVLVLLGSYLGTVAAAAGGTRQYIGVMGKADRMVWLAVAAPLVIAAGVSPALTGYLVLVAAGSALTLGQRARAIRRQLGGNAAR